MLIIKGYFFSFIFRFMKKVKIKTYNDKYEARIL